MSAKKSSKISGAGIDWSVIEMDYIYGFRNDTMKPKRHSYDSLSKKYNLTAHAVSIYAKKNNWIEKRDKSNTEINDFVMEQIKTNRINQIASFDDNAFTAIRIINSIVMEKLLITNDEGTKSVNKDLKSTELQKLTAVIMNNVNTKKAIFGDQKRETSENLSSFNEMLENMRREREEE